jgi:hypothetical protein
MKRVIFQIVPSIIYGVGPRLAAILGQLGLHPTARLGRRLLERLKKGGNLPVNVDGLLMSGSLGVHHWYLNELREGRQEAFTADLFERAIKPGMVVLDIGAALIVVSATSSNGTRINADEGARISVNPHESVSKS